MRLIDSHMHVDLAGFDVKMIIGAMDRNGVEISWLLTWEELNPPVRSLHMDLLPEPVIEAFNSYPDRFIPLYAPDPFKEDQKQPDSVSGYPVRFCLPRKKDPAISRHQFYWSRT